MVDDKKTERRKEKSEGWTDGQRKTDIQQSTAGDNNKCMQCTIEMKTWFNTPQIQ